MRFRNWIATLALAAVAMPTRAADAPPAAPTLLIRLKSVDGIMADAHYFATLVGQEEQAKQFEKLLPAFLGPQGLAGTGIDTKKPIGAYGILDPQLPNSQVVVMIPVADEKVFVETLKKVGGMIPNVNATITPGNDGIYTVSSPAAPVEAYFTVADGYAYVTALRKETIAAGTRLSAAKLLPADDRTLAGVTLRLDQIDDNLKQIALLQLENQLAAAKEQKGPNETPAQAKLKAELIDHFSRQFKALLRDGRGLDLQLVVDRKTDDLSAQLSLSAKPDTPLAQDIAGQASKPSRFGQFANAVGQAALNVAVPAELRAGLGAALDDAFKQSQERETDATKKAHAQKIYETLSPTLKAGVLDLFGGLNGPDAGGKYTLFGGIKVKDAPAIERMVKDLVPQIPDAKAKEAVKLDAETVDGVKVHKVTPHDLDEEAKRVFGPNAIALVAMPADAVVVAFGADAAGALRQLLATPGKPGGPFAGELSLARAAALDKENGPAAKKAAAEAFGTPPKGDVIRVTVEGGRELRARASVKGAVIKFGVKLDEAKKGGAAP